MSREVWGEKPKREKISITKEEDDDYIPKKRSFSFLFYTMLFVFILIVIGWLVPIFSDNVVEETQEVIETYTIEITDMHGRVIVKMDNLTEEWILERNLARKTIFFDSLIVNDDGDVWKKFIGEYYGRYEGECEIKIIKEE